MDYLQMGKNFFAHQSLFLKSFLEILFKHIYLIHQTLLKFLLKQGVCQKWLIINQFHRNLKSKLHLKE